MYWFEKPWKFAEYPYAVRHELLGEKLCKTYHEAWDHFTYLRSHGIERNFIHLFVRFETDEGVLEEGPRYWWEHKKN